MAVHAGDDEDGTTFLHEIPTTPGRHGVKLLQE